MVVDDNVDAAETLAQWLRSCGHRVLIESSPFRALEVAAAFHADAYLLDIGLPGMDGKQLARRLRETAHGSKALLIGISGYGLDQDREAARQAGFDHYFVKPVDTGSLAELLRV
jgi:CheY-like chemotaxis protein